MPAQLPSCLSVTAPWLLCNVFLFYLVLAFGSSSVWTHFLSCIHRPLAFNPSTQMTHLHRSPMCKCPLDIRVTTSQIYPTENRSCNLHFSTLVHKAGPTSRILNPTDFQCHLPGHTGPETQEPIWKLSFSSDFHGKYQVLLIQLRPFSSGLGILLIGLW